MHRALHTFWAACAPNGSNRTHETSPRPSPYPLPTSGNMYNGTPHLLAGRLSCLARSSSSPAILESTLSLRSLNLAVSSPLDGTENSILYLLSFLPFTGPKPSSILDSDNRRPISGKKARASKQGNSVTPNPLRPHVPAADRLQGWQTPFSRDFDTSLISQFGLDFFHHFHKVLLASLDEPTRVNYGAGLLRFTQFCDEHGISERDRMPASFLLLACFAARHAGEVGGRSCSLAPLSSHFLQGLRSRHGSQASQHGTHSVVPLGKAMKKSSQK